MLTPAKIEQETGVAPKQQSKLRKEGGFIPFRQTKVGGTVIYSIYAVAEYLLGDDQGLQKPDPAEDSGPEPSTKKPVRRRHADNSVEFCFAGGFPSLGVFQTGKGFGNGGEPRLTNAHLV